MDLSSESYPEEPDARRRGRRFLGVRFDCCSVYARVYINRDATAYAGCCPRCSRPVRFEIGHGGTDSRFFTAY